MATKLPLIIDINHQLGIHPNFFIHPSPWQSKPFQQHWEVAEVPVQPTAPRGTSALLETFKDKVPLTPQMLGGMFREPPPPTRRIRTQCHRPPSQSDTWNSAFSADPAGKDAFHMYSAIPTPLSEKAKLVYSTQCQQG